MTQTSSHPESASWDLLSADPYPTYAALRRERPVAWMPSLGMWWVTRHEDVRAVLLDPDHFIVGTEASLLHDTFGEHMLTTEGARHDRYRDGWLNGAFMPASLASLRAGIRARTASLLDDAWSQGRVELRRTIASRLPVLTMLDLFGFADDAEPLIRQWYNDFEAALANQAHNPAVSAKARASVTAFHAFLQSEIEAVRSRPRPGLLNDLLVRPAEVRLTDDEIRRNALIMLFGGISTVEAVTLNTLWALLGHPEALTKVLADRRLLDAAFDESVRWLSPVQSATRHTVEACEIRGVAIPAGATVNCMIASANRDAQVFADPDRFDISRPNARRHLGFATGPHLCLGRHLAREEALSVLNHIFDNTRNLRIADPIAAPAGHEFRQPSSLWLEWDAR